jgi:chorismate-pyruvate lyase
VELSVLDHHLEGKVYTRKVSLAPAGGAVIEWGIVRLDLRFMSDAVRDEILARHTPLGEILIKHDVHRRIKPRWFLRFPGRGPLLTFFGDPTAKPMYGRIGTIYCDDEPAIELLEIVTV